MGFMIDKNTENNSKEMTWLNHLVSCRARIQVGAPDSITVDWPRVSRQLRCGDKMCQRDSTASKELALTN